jgi:N-acetylneuraminic acid mutarotase
LNLTKLILGILAAVSFIASIVIGAFASRLESPFAHIWAQFLGKPLVGKKPSKQPLIIWTGFLVFLCIGASSTAMVEILDSPSTIVPPTITVVQGSVPTTSNNSQSPSAPTSRWNFINPELWVEDSSLLTPRAYFEAIAINGFIYAVGGRNGNERLSSVEYVKVNSDRSLGTWQYTSSLNSPRSMFAVVHANGYLYAIGGEDGTGNVYDTIERATILSDGSLSNWEIVSRMNQNRYALEAVTINGYIYILGGDNGRNTTLTSVERAAFYDDGSIGGWETVNSMNNERAVFSAVIIKNYLYVLGGWNKSFEANNQSAINSVERAIINPDGSLSEWNFVQSLEVPAEGHTAVSAGGMIFVIGGDNRSQNLDSVQQTEMDRDGNIIAWKTIESLPTPRTGLAAVYIDSIYLIGGQNQNTYNSVVRTNN